MRAMHLLFTLSKGDLMDGNIASVTLRCRLPMKSGKYLGLAVAEYGIPSLRLRYCITIFLCALVMPTTKTIHFIS